MVRSYIHPTHTPHTLPSNVTPGLIKGDNPECQMMISDKNNNIYSYSMFEKGVLSSQDSFTTDKSLSNSLIFFQHF